MRPYIKNLTDQLINKNNFDFMFDSIMTRDAENPRVFLGKAKRVFLESVETQLEAGDVGKMNPSTLGEIMSSLEIGDVMVGKEELFKQLHFSGNCEELLRELVATCLAFLIHDRLDPNNNEDNPHPIEPYQKNWSKKKV